MQKRAVDQTVQIVLKDKKKSHKSFHKIFNKKQANGQNSYLEIINMSTKTNNTHSKKSSRGKQTSSKNIQKSKIFFHKYTDNNNCKRLYEYIENKFGND